MKQLLPLLLISINLVITGCGNNHHFEQHGYIEGKFTYVASQTTGNLDQISVKRGDLVKKGQALFKLDLYPQVAEVNQAKANLEEAQSQLANLLKGKRPSELAAIKAQQRQVQAKIKFAKRTVERYKRLAKQNLIAKEKLDQAVSEHNNLTAQLHEFQENLTTAKLKAREDEIKAAKAKVQSTKAAFQQAHWQLTQKTIFSPVTGQVFDTFYRIGEVVPTNTPVLSIIAPENIYAVFFVPEEQLASLSLRQKIKVSCDSCTQAYTALITFISPEAEFTPPVIYSEKTRSKLVYRIEAQPSLKDAPKLHPGQPITIDFSKDAHDN